MKKLMTLLLGGIALSATAQNPSLKFAQVVDGGNNWSEAIATDHNGNVYLAGQFKGTIDLDPSSNTVNHTSAGEEDIYLVKYDANGNYIWGFDLGSTGDDRVFDIIIAPNNDVLIAGWFENTVEFDPTGGYSLSSHGGWDGYVARYNQNGALQWAFNVGGNSTDLVETISLDLNGNLIISGSFRNTADFNPLSGTYNLTAANSADGFLARYDPLLLLDWAISYDPFIESHVVDDLGNIYAVGGFSGTFDFDPSANSDNLTASGNSDMYISKFDSTGNHLWVKAISGTGTGSIKSIEMAPDYQSIYVSGYFEDTCDFNPSPVAQQNLISNNSSRDIYVAKYDNGGNYLWVKTIGSDNSDYFNALTVSPYDEVFITGSLVDSIDFDPGSGVDMAHINNEGIFMLQLDASGNYGWGEYLHGDTYAGGLALATDDAGNLYVTGFQTGTVDFDPTPLVANVAPTNDGTFIAKYNYCGSRQDVVLSLCAGDSVFLQGAWQSQNGVFVDVTEINGCDSVVVSTVTVHPLPVVSFTGLDSIYCDDDAAVNLTGTPAGGTFSGNGVNNGAFNPATAGVGTHVIGYLYTDGNGCSADTMASVIVEVCTGVETYPTATLHLYPNPVNDRLFIRQSEQFATYSIYDMTGKALVNQAPIPQNGTVLMQDLPDGVYLFVCTTEHGDRNTQKIIKK